MGTESLNPEAVQGLRERNAPQNVESQLEAQKMVRFLNADEEEADRHEKEKKTYGRTPDGVAGTIFLFWRICYNVGIGYLLQIQSNHRRLVKWAKKSKVFVDPATGENPHPALYKLIKRELETKIPKDYKFEDAPIEYNTWLVFRRVVDLILMCDFVSYCLFALACGHRPVNEGVAMTFLRWFGGISLVIFNLWVKLDAHRVVKDYAWYWGDFFYLIDQELTFDGVFEMAPHPMYSVGYAGYYGISSMAGSYPVLFISIIAHAAQFAFLVLVENPHIDKTYNTPPPSRKCVPDTNSPLQSPEASATELSVDPTTTSSTATPSKIHKLLGLRNFDLHRVTDISVFLFQFYILFIAVLTPSTPFYKTLFVLHAAAWRLWYAFGIGYILNRQSAKKQWTRHFVKFGDSTEEAWRQWKGMYHLSMAMCYASFIAAVYKTYSFPPSWEYGFVLLKHVIGTSLIALQIWTAVSIYDSLGEFGWFYGDFFFDQTPKLTYNGIYRFLNNPERVIGLAGVWGAALITGSRSIFFLAFLSHTVTLFFIHFIERPHMQKLYGRSLRRDSGISKTIKRSLPPPLKQWQGNVDKMVSDTMDVLEEFIEAARPKLAAGVNTIVKDTTALFQNYPARISITRLAPDLAGFDPKDYSLQIEGEPSSAQFEAEKTSGKESQTARFPPEHRSDFRTLNFKYGAPIKVKWTAPLNHSKRDWVSLYMVADNASREVTRISSQGRWVATNEGQYDTATADAGILVSDVLVSGKQRQDGESKDYLSGEVEFSGDKLWWTQGVFEFRYHHDGKHNVMAISLPFEVRIGRFDEEHLAIDDENGIIREAIQDSLLSMVRNCFDRDPDIAPSNSEEPFGNLVDRDGKYAKRVVYAVHYLFGIEFAPEVVKADGNVKNLAWRVLNAKKVLAPYSMSSSRASRGTTTPITDEKD
ncbi:MAG: phosphatidylethanolamine N-methyltransferase [Cirrosporium novae-zelandiae]|nr:MAG: phosphatidylethanolamine N-methyltransferase [Cirrosporium novae-zelandiae]